MDVSESVLDNAIYGNTRSGKGTSRTASPSGTPYMDKKKRELQKLGWDIWKTERGSANTPYKSRKKGVSKLAV